MNFPHLAQSLSRWVTKKIYFIIVNLDFPICQVGDNSASIYKMIHTHICIEMHMYGCVYI